MGKINMKPKQQKEEWEDEFVELYGYLDKYVNGIVGRQGKWFAQALAKEQAKTIRELDKKYNKLAEEKVKEERKRAKQETLKKIEEEIDRLEYSWSGVLLRVGSKEVIETLKVLQKKIGKLKRS